MAMFSCGVMSDFLLLSLMTVGHSVGTPPNILEVVHTLWALHLLLGSSYTSAVVGGLQCHSDGRQSSTVKSSNEYPFRYYGYT